MRILSFLFLPALIILADLAIRRHVAAGYDGAHAGFFALSALFTFLLYKGIHALLHRLRHRGPAPLYPVALSAVGLGCTVVLLASYGYFEAMNLMPNYFTIEFLRSEPRNSWTLVRDTVGVIHLLASPALLGLIFFFLHRSTREPRRLWAWPLKGKAVHALISLALLFVFNNNVRFFDQCFTADVNTLAFTTRHIYNTLSRKDLGSVGLQARTPSKVESPLPNQGVNLLLIATESLRRSELSLYGYHRPTTARLDSFVRAHPRETYVFDRAFSNAATTFLAFPSLLHGVSPLQSSLLYHSAPLMFEYAKAAGYATFLISSHDYRWYNFKSYFSTTGADVFWSREESGLPAVNDLGIDDRATLSTLLGRLDTLAHEKKPFAGLFHVNVNHYPYHTPPEFIRWKGSPQDLYDNTLLLLDSILGRLLTRLKELGLDSNTVIVLTSDHGEGFREHGFIGHFGFYYTEAVRIPMLIRIPPPLLGTYDTTALRANLSDNVSNIDLLPTLLDFMRIHDLPSVRPHLARLTGASLLKPLPPGRDILISNINELTRYKTGVSLVRDSLHYIYSMRTVPPKEELFNLLRDPGEKNDLWPLQQDSLKESFRIPFKSVPALSDIYR